MLCRDDYIKYEVAVGHVLLDIGRMCAKDIYALMQLDIADGVTPQENKDMLLYTDY